MNIEITTRSQDEILKALKNAEENSEIYALDKLSSKTPLMTQVKKLSNEERANYPDKQITSNGSIVGFFSENTDEIYVLNDEDIFLNALQKKIKGRFEHLEESSIIFNNDESEFDYKLREKAVLVNVNHNGIQKQFNVYPDRSNQQIRIIELNKELSNKPKGRKRKIG